MQESMCVQGKDQRTHELSTSCLGCPIKRFICLLCRYLGRLKKDVEAREKASKQRRIERLRTMFSMLEGAKKMKLEKYK